MTTQWKSLCFRSSSSIHIQLFELQRQRLRCVHICSSSSFSSFSVSDCAACTSAAAAASQASASATTRFAHQPQRCCSSLKFSDFSISATRDMHLPAAFQRHVMHSDTRLPTAFQRRAMYGDTRLPAALQRHATCVFRQLFSDMRHAPSTCSSFCDSSSGATSRASAAVQFFSGSASSVNDRYSLFRQFILYFLGSAVTATAATTQRKHRTCEIQQLQLQRSASALRQLQHQRSASACAAASAFSVRLCGSISFQRAPVRQL